MHIISRSQRKNETSCEYVRNEMYYEVVFEKVVL